MNSKLLKIARYLGQNGFYKEAANLKKLAEEAPGARRTDDDSDMDVLDRSDREDRGLPKFQHGSHEPNPENHWLMSMAPPYTKKEIEAGMVGGNLKDLGSGPDQKAPAGYPGWELQPGQFGYMPSGRISATFFMWCRKNGLKPTERSLAQFLTTKHPPVAGFGGGGQIPRRYWKKIKDLVREHPDYEGAELEPHLERIISETGPDGGFNYAMDDEDDN